MILLAAVAGYALRAVTSPVGDGAAVDVVIPPGAHLPQIAALLYERGLVRHPAVFVWAARTRGLERSVQAGRYRFSPAEDVGTILRRLAAGDVVAVTVVIPEGFTAAQVAAAFASAGVADEQDILVAFRNAGREVLVPEMRGNPSGSLEGYLFPDTYRMSPDASGAEVARAMIARFRAAAGPMLAARLPMGLPPHAVLTVASMVEREARVPSERPTIAGVIYNRLRRGMRLEIDATVLYALGRHKSVVLNQDLNVDSPYNTYRVAGLPPGPIANPGLASIAASVRPAGHEYLYYVARPDGSHVFSRTFSEHERAIREVRRTP